MPMRLGELILYVRDMSAQVAFYRDVLQLTLLEPAGATDFHQTHWAVFDTGECRLCLHSGGQQEFGSDAPRAVFFVDDLEEWRERLLGHHLSVSPIRSPAPGVRVFEARDPEGYLLSLEETHSPRGS